MSGTDLSDVEPDPFDLKNRSSGAVKIERTVVPTDTSKADVLFSPIFGFNVRRGTDRIGGYLPTDEVTAKFQECVREDDRRGITAVLRIMDEQISFREPLKPSKRGFGGLLALILILLTYGVLARVKAPFFIPAGITVFFCLLNVIEVRRLRPLEEVYKAERETIYYSAAGAIDKLVGHQRFPKRLYREDLRRLERLTERYDWFGPIRDSIVAASG